MRIDTRSKKQDSSFRPLSLRLAVPCDRVSTSAVRRASEIPPLLHGNHWTGQHVGGWWCSPKFDGWRAYWTGSQLVSRQGNGYRAPASFTASLPAFPLDCELWLGHGFTDKDVHKAVAHGQWEKLWIVAFDVPGTIAETGIQILRSLILTLAESDRKNETAISDKIVANLAAAFEALKKGIEPVSFARR